MRNEVKYILSLEARQFLREMVNARREAKDAARSLGNDFGGAMASAKRDAQGAQSAMQGFSAAQSSLARAMGGDFVGAAGAATVAIKSLTAAMVANPWLALAAAAIAVAAAIAKAASSAAEYRRRVSEAREENVAFAKSLAAIADKWQAGQDRKAFDKDLQKADGATIEKAIAEQERKTEAAWDKAIRAGQNLEWEKSRYKPDEERVKAATEKRDAARDAYAEQLAILSAYREMLEGWQTKQQQQATANKDELDRRALAKAGDDEFKLLDVLRDRRVEASRKFGGGEEMYEERLKAGKATDEEIAARREIETIEKRILEIAKRKVEEARALEKVERERAEAAAKAEAQAAAEARKRLNDSRENALVRAGRPEELEARANRLEARADEKFGEWSGDKILNASQEELTARAEVERVRGLAEQARANRDGEKETPKPWVEGVVAARGMSIGDVFNNMRGMNGAMEKDPNTEYHRRTAEGVGNMQRDIQKIANALARDGVQ